MFGRTFCIILYNLDRFTGRLTSISTAMSSGRSRRGFISPVDEDKNRTLVQWRKLPIEILRLKCNGAALVSTGAANQLAKRLHEFYSAKKDVSTANLSQVVPEKAQSSQVQASDCSIVDSSIVDSSIVDSSPSNAIDIAEVNHKLSSLKSVVADLRDSQKAVIELLNAAKQSNQRTSTSHSSQVTDFVVASSTYSSPQLPTPVPCTVSTDPQHDLNFPANISNASVGDNIGQLQGISAASTSISTNSCYGYTNSGQHGFPLPADSTLHNNIVNNNIPAVPSSFVSQVFSTAAPGIPPTGNDLFAPPVGNLYLAHDNSARNPFTAPSISVAIYNKIKNNDFIDLDDLLPPRFPSILTRMFTN